MLENIIYLVPMISVMVFSLLERFAFNRQTLDAKTRPIFLIVLINLLVSLVFSASLLFPFVILVAPLQFFTIAELNIPEFLIIILSILIIDFIYYVTHRLHHRIPLLWRLHRLHHSDTQINAQTTLLHHPLELVTNNLFVILGAVMLGLPTIALFYYGIILGLHSAFTHIEFAIPPKLERYMRWFFITPNYHHRHHAKALKISNTNFGMLFVYWDWLFKTALFNDDKDSNDYGIQLKETPIRITLWHFLTNPLR